MTRRWTGDDVGKALEELDLPRGGVTLVHSSLVALGPADGLAPSEVPAALATSVRSHVGPGGTIVVPTFTFAFCRGESFDVATTPSEQMGAFAEHIRLLPESRRSAHPMQSISAVGPLAGFLTEPDSLTAFGVGGSWHRLIEADTTVLMLGAPLQTVSLVHWSEERAQVPYRYMKSFRGGWRRSPREAFVEREYAMYARDLTIDPRLELSILADGLGDDMRTAKLGAGNLHAFSAARVIETTDRLIAEDPWALVGGERCEQCAARPWPCPHGAEPRITGKGST